MALFERLLESRALSYQTIFKTGLDTFPARPESGFFVDADAAMRDDAVWAAQRLIAGDVSTLPVEAFTSGFENDRTVRKPLRPKPDWIETPDPYDPSFTRISHFGEVVLSILQNGNSFTYVEPSVLNPVRLEVIQPQLVQPKKPAGQREPTYEISDSRGRVLKELTSLEMIHIAPFRKPGALRGLNPIEAAAEGIGISMAAERYTSRYFLSGASMPGFVTTPGDLTPDQIDEMDRRMRKAKGGWRNSGVLGYLTGGASYIPSGIKPSDSDLSAIRSFQVEAIARRYGIPPHMLGIPDRGNSPASVEQKSIDYITHCLRHYVEPIEIAYRRLVPGDASTYLKFNFSGLLRGDIVSRFQAYNIGIRDGFFSIDDVRAFEDMGPVKGGDVYRVQAQMTDITLEADVAPVPGVPGVGGNVTGGPIEPASPAAAQNTARSLPQEIHYHFPEQRSVVNVPPTVVNVEPAQVHIAPTEVHVAPAEVTVHPADIHLSPVIDIPATIVNVTTPEVDLAPIGDAMQEQARSMGAVAAAMQRPRTLRRDSSGKVLGTE